jgi:2-oxoglutarate ferredoxin oxidoreductase subunit alpha
VIVATDQVIGHMSENLVVKDLESYEIIERKARDKSDNYKLVYDFTKDFIPMILPGTGFKGNIDSLTHDEKGYPSNEPEIEEKMIRHILSKIQDNEDKIIEYEEYMVDDADTVVIAYGITARSARKAVKDARKEGYKLGLFRPITLWPFPKKENWAD